MSKNSFDIQFIRSFQGINEYRLSNGLQVLFFRDPSQANVTVNITYLVGSRHEGRGEAGMAHLLEHMLFRGTHDLRDVKGALQDRGAQFNATTWYDRTNYFETLNATDENLEFALRLEADRMINSTILASDLESEMTVVRNEFEMGENNPVHVLHDQMMSAAYLWHNYGKTTIGNRSDIERVPVKNLRAFYEHYYQPDNAVLTIAGNFDEERAMDLVAHYYLKIPKPARILEDTYTKEPAQDGPREVILQRVGDVASVAVAYHIPSASHEDHAAVKVFVDCMCDEPAGILYKELVESAKCSEVFSSTYALCEPGMALCFARPSENVKAESIRDELIELVEGKASSSLDEAQVERIKTRILKQIKLSMKDSKNLALKLSEAIACGDWRLFFWYKAQIERVTWAQVQSVAKKYFIASNRTSGLFIPQKHQQRVDIDHVDSIEPILAHLTDDESIGAGEEFLAEPENIEARVQRSEVGVGQKTAILVKKTRGQSVKAKLILHFGQQESLTPYVNEFELMPAMLWRGTKNLSYQALRDKLDALMTSISLDSACGQLSISLNSERKHIAAALDLVTEMVKAPAFDEKEFAVVKRREIDDIEEIKSDPQRLGFLELERLKSPWPKDHILYVPSFEEKIAHLKDIKLASIKEAFYNLVNVNNFSFSLVGDAELDDIKNCLQQNLRLDEGKVPYARVPSPFIKNIAQDLVFDTKDKEMAIVTMAFNFALRDDHEDYAALKLANYMFGETMNSRLMNRIREKEGISYGAGSFMETSRFDEFSSLNVYAMAAPQSVARARAAMNEEFLRLINDGVEDAELETAKVSIRSSFENMLAGDGYLASALASDLEIGRTFFWRKNLFSKIATLSALDIKTAMQKWWANIEFSRVCAGDKARF